MKKLAILCTVLMLTAMCAPALAAESSTADSGQVWGINIGGTGGPGGQPNNVEATGAEVVGGWNNHATSDTSKLVLAYNQGNNGNEVIALGAQVVGGSNSNASVTGNVSAMNGANSISVTSWNPYAGTPDKVPGYTGNINNTVTATGAKVENYGFFAGNNNASTNGSVSAVNLGNGSLAWSIFGVSSAASSNDVSATGSLVQGFGSQNTAQMNGNVSAYNDGNYGNSVSSQGAVAIGGTNTHATQTGNVWADNTGDAAFIPGIVSPDVVVANTGNTVSATGAKVESYGLFSSGNVASTTGIVGAQNSGNVGNSVTATGSHVFTFGSNDTAIARDVYAGNTGFSGNTVSATGAEVVAGFGGSNHAFANSWVNAINTGSSGNDVTATGAQIYTFGSGNTATANGYVFASNSGNGGNTVSALGASVIGGSNNHATSVNTVAVNTGNGGNTVRATGAIVH